MPCPLSLRAKTKGHPSSKIMNFQLSDVGLTLKWGKILLTNNTGGLEHFFLQSFIIHPRLIINYV